MLLGSIWESAISLCIDYTRHYVSIDYRHFPDFPAYYLNYPFVRENLSRIIFSSDLRLKIDHYKCDP